MSAHLQRIFIAAKIPESVRRRVEDCVAPLRRRFSQVKWTRPENLHCTLKFLGDVTKPTLKKVMDATETLALLHQRFRVSLFSCGMFPDRSFPHIFWVGVRDGNRELSILARDLDREMKHLGFQPEKRPFNSHLTVGRLRLEKTFPPTLVQQFEESFQQVELGEFLLDKVTIYASELGMQGPSYTALQSCLLRENSSSRTSQLMQSIR